MTGGAAAAAQWIVTGICPDVIRVDTPIGKTLYLDVIPKSERTDLSQEVVSKSEETNTSIEMNTSKDFNTFAEKGRSVNRDRVLRTCGIIKDAGDDPDVTGGSEIVTTVELLPEKGEISFVGDEGIG
ncbi:MAG: cobalt-precorrin-5B (C(1))-methyltransferase, partial [Clostridiales bacterium]|nr:cobalt-precorrin-5B (C(1))-methyltransferase [Clostridiales bacterium]